MGNETEKAFGKLVKFSGNQLYAYIDLGGEKPEWCNMDERVQAFIKGGKANIPNETEVDIEYTVLNGKKVLSRIAVHGAPATEAPAQTQEAPKNDGKPHCEKCGKELKDAKYKLCYTCNKDVKDNTPAEPEKKEPGASTEKPTGGYRGKTKEELENIIRTNANNATASALVALQGQIDLNDICRISTKLYLHFYRLSTESIAVLKKEVE